MRTRKRAPGCVWLCASLLLLAAFADHLTTWYYVLPGSTSVTRGNSTNTKEHIMQKASKKAHKALNAKLAALVSSAAAIGFNIATGYAAAVELVIAVKASANALSEAGEQYKQGYVARSLLGNAAYAKRWDNLDQAGQCEAAGEIIAKATPESTKPDRRTQLEHKAVRAADVSWSKVKRAAGIAATKKGNRKPRTSTASTGNVPPVDLVKASPKLDSKEAANDYFGTAAAALLATVDKNAKLVDPRLSSAVSDFLAAVKKALGIEVTK